MATTLHASIRSTTIMLVVLNLLFNHMNRGNSAQQSVFTAHNQKDPTVTDDLVVRPVDQDDFSDWKVLWDGYNAFYGRHGDTALPEKVTQTTWARFFDAYEPMHALVAERAGKLLGLTHILFHRSTTLLGPSCYLQDLFTAESARGLGIGRALIEQAYRQAMAGGAQRFYWLTHETNAQAMQLYDKLAQKSGFVVYSKTSL